MLFLLSLFEITLNTNIVHMVELPREAGKMVKTFQVLILLPQATALPVSGKPKFPKLFFIEEAQKYDINRTDNPCMDILCKVLGIATYFTFWGWEVRGHTLTNLPSSVLKPEIATPVRMDFGKHPRSRLLFSKTQKGFTQPSAY